MTAILNFKANIKHSKTLSSKSNKRQILSRWVRSHHKNKWKIKIKKHLRTLLISIKNRAITIKINQIIHWAPIDLTGLKIKIRVIKLGQRHSKCLKML